MRTINNNENSSYIGLDVGGTNIKAALIEPNGTILFHKNVPNKVGEPALRHILEEIDTLIDHASQNNYPRVDGIGIAVPGKIDSLSKVIIHAPNLEWKYVDLISMITEQCSLPVKICNDTNAAVLGEYAYGGHDENNFVCMTIGTGVGAGIMLDGQLYTGVQSLAGEMGHMVMEPGGPACSCGNRGCLEALASAPAMIKRYTSRTVRSAVTDLVSPVRNEKTSTNNIEVRDIVHYAQTGDSDAMDILHETATALGIAMANTSNLLDIRTFILSGGVMKTEWPLREMISDVTNANSLSPVQVKTSTLIDCGANLGAIALFSNNAHG